jgi:hypothetical protein
MIPLPFPTVASPLPVLMLLLLAVVVQVLLLLLLSLGALWERFLRMKPHELLLVVLHSIPAKWGRQ